MAQNADWAKGLYQFRTELRAPWNNLFVAKAFKDPKTGKLGEPKFDITLLVPEDSVDLAPMREVLTNVVKEKWGSDPAGWPATIKGGEGLPIVHGAKLIQKAVAKGKAENALYKGAYVMTPRTLKEPGLGVLVPGKGIVNLDTELLKAQYKGKFYGGCYVGVEVHFTPYDGFGGGVTAYLQNVVWLRDGPRTTGSNPAETFKDFMGSYTPTVDPTGGAGLGVPAQTGNMDAKLPF